MPIDPVLGRWRQEVSLALLPSWCSWFCELRVQWDILSQEIRGRGTEEDTRHQPSVSTHMCIQYTHIHIYIHICNICIHTWTDRKRSSKQGLVKNSPDKRLPQKKESPHGAPTPYYHKTQWEVRRLRRWDNKICPFSTGTISILENQDIPY